MLLSYFSCLNKLLNLYRTIFVAIFIFDKIFYFFGSGNIADARKLWAKYKKQSFALNFYKKDESGWVKVDL